MKVDRTPVPHQQQQCSLAKCLYDSFLWCFKRYKPLSDHSTHSTHDFKKKESDECLEQGVSISIGDFLAASENEKEI